VSVRTLGVLGLIELSLLAALGWLPPMHRMPWPGIFCFAAAFLAYAVAGLLAVRRTAGDADRSVVKLVWIFAIAMRAALLPVSPELSDDFHRYLWDGHVQSAGTNPYLFAPADPEVAHLRTDGHELINNPTVPTIYPPLAQLAFLIVALAGSSVWLMKALWIACDLATAWVLGRIARETGRHEVPVLLLYLWAPLLVVEVSWSAHLEPLGLLPLAGAIWAAQRLRLAAGNRSPAADDESRHEGSSPGLAGCTGALLALSALVKFAPAAALPALVRRTGQRGRPELRTTVAALGAFGLTLAVLYAPYASAGPALFAGLRTYSQHWWFMKGAFGVVEALTGDPLRARRVVGLLVVAVIAGTAVARFDLERTLFWVLGAGMILTPTLHPWYVLWMLPLAALRSSPPWIALGGLAFLGYFGLGSYQETGVWVQPPGLRAALWLPFFGLLLADVRKLGRPQAIETATSPSEMEP
jgi:hypothetical protein